MSQAVGAALAQEAQRSFMSGVYGWMCTGLGVSGVTAFLAASSETMMMNSAYYAWLLFIVGFVAAFTLPDFARRLRVRAVAALFLGYSLLNGLTFTVILAELSIGDAVCPAMLLTAGTFGAMGVFTTVTKKDLSARGSFLFMGLLGVPIACLVQILDPRSMLEAGPMMSFVIACGSVGIFAALIAQEARKLREQHASTGYSPSMSVSIIGALQLYRDFIASIYVVLSWFGERRRRRHYNPLRS
jgi:hypothetical protein